MTLQLLAAPRSGGWIMDKPQGQLTAAEVGDLLRQRRETRGLTQDQVADLLEVDKSYISKLEGGVHHAGRSKYFPKLAQVLHLSEADIRAVNPSAVFETAPLLPALPGASSEMTETSQRGETLGGIVISADTITIPVHGSATAGSPADFAPEANVTAHETIDRRHYRNGNTLAIYAVGHSMSPGIEDGDLVLADRSLTDLVDGKMYVVLIAGQGACVKRARFFADAWWLTSDHPDHLPFQASEATVLARVYRSQSGKDH